MLAGGVLVCDWRMVLWWLILGCTVPGLRCMTLVWVTAEAVDTLEVLVSWASLGVGVRGGLPPPGCYFSFHALGDWQR